MRKEGVYHTGGFFGTAIPYGNTDLRGYHGWSLDKERCPDFLIVEVLSKTPTWNSICLYTDLKSGLRAWIHVDENSHWVEIK